MKSVTSSLFYFGQYSQTRGLLLLLAFCTGLGACSRESGSPAGQPADSLSSRPLSVYVVNYPLQCFAQRIGGPHVKVTFRVPSDGDPAFRETGVEQVVALQQADLVLLNGASYARWVQRISLPASRTVDTSAAFSDRYIPTTAQATHSHGAAGKSSCLIIWEGGPMPEILAMLKKRGVESRVFEPCPKQPGSGGYLSVMRENVARLSAVALPR